jgi:membrane-associated phospholipid phosphatase
MLARIARAHLPLIGAAIAEDWPIYAFVAVFFAVGYAIVVTNGGTPLGMLQSYLRIWFTNFGAIGPITVMALGCIHIVHRLDERRRLGFRHMFAPPRVARFVAGIVLMLTAGILFMSTFSSLKTTMGIAGGFQFDVVQADIDKAIHFGVDPWRWLYALGHHPWVQRVLEYNYNVGWFVVCYGLLFWWVTSPRTRSRHVRYVLSIFSTWVLVGNILAASFLSAGPAFYGRVTGDTARFGELLGYLQVSAGQFSSAVTFQNYLWYLFAHNMHGLGSGISAFPSMHVALITMNALFIGELSRRWAMVFWGYAAVVMFSSVYLGWHYAIDGYVSIVVVVALYWGIRKLAPLFARLRWRSADAVAAGTALS